MRGQQLQGGQAFAALVGIHADAFLLRDDDGALGRRAGAHLAGFPAQVGALVLQKTGVLQRVEDLVARQHARFGLDVGIAFAEQQVAADLGAVGRQFGFLDGGTVDQRLLAKDFAQQLGFRLRQFHARARGIEAGHHIALFHQAAIVDHGQQFAVVPARSGHQQRRVGRGLDFTLDIERFQPHARRQRFGRRALGAVAAAAGQAEHDGRAEEFIDHAFPFGGSRVTCTAVPGLIPFGTLSKSSSRSRTTTGWLRDLPW